MAASAEGTPAAVTAAVSTAVAATRAAWLTALAAAAAACSLPAAWAFLLLHVGPSSCRPLAPGKQHETHAFMVINIVAAQLRAGKPWMLATYVSLLQPQSRVGTLTCRLCRRLL